VLLEPMLHIRGYPAVIRPIAALKQIDAVWSIVIHIENVAPGVLHFAVGEKDDSPQSRGKEHRKELNGTGNA
jgi:hypothetical protein